MGGTQTQDKSEFDQIFIDEAEIVDPYCPQSSEAPAAEKNDSKTIEIRGNRHQRRRMKAIVRKLENAQRPGRKV